MSISYGNIRSPILVSGIVLVMLGFAVNYIGDLVKMRHKEEELDMIAEAFREALEEYQSERKEEMKEEFKKIIDKILNDR